MKKILLAISGISPRLSVFHYTTELCTRIKADLNILQIVRAKASKNNLKKVSDKAGLLRRRLEDTMTAAAFAEAGDHDTARDILNQAKQNLDPLLTEAEEAGITCEVTFKTGEPEKEIIRYLKGHRDVVLAVYDTTPEKKPSSRGKRFSALEGITGQSPVPVVMVR